MDAKKYGIPVVGEGCTFVYWSDREAYTITRVSASGKTFWAKRDFARRTDRNGMSDAQTYEYTPNPDAYEECVRLTKNGWKSRGTRVWVGVRDEHFDYSF